MQRTPVGQEMDVQGYFGVFAHLVEEMNMIWRGFRTNPMYRQHFHGFSLKTLAGNGF